jgi:hypothetical protein
MPAKRLDAASKPVGLESRFDQTRRAAPAAPPPDASRDAPPVPRRSRSPRPPVCRRGHVRGRVPVRRHVPSVLVESVGRDNAATARPLGACRLELERRWRHALVWRPGRGNLASLNTRSGSGQRSFKPQVPGFDSRWAHPTPLREATSLLRSAFPPTFPRRPQRPVRRAPARSFDRPSKVGIDSLSNL